MRLPRWLDRENRIHVLTVLLRQSQQGQRDAFRLYSRKCQEVLELKAEVERLRGAS